MSSSNTPQGHQIETPRLPPELECIIFELAATLKGTSFTLLLVAKRVYEWIYPTLFTVLQLDSSPVARRIKELLEPTRNTNSDFPAHAVRRIAIPSTALFEQVIRACHNLTHIALYNDANIGVYTMHAIVALPRLQYLATVSTIWSRLLAVPLPASGPAFPSLTHLDLLHFRSSRSSWLYIPWTIALPALTHLALLTENLSSSDPEWAALLPCPTLRALILLPALSSDTTFLDRVAPHVSDPRLVLFRSAPGSWLDTIIPSEDGLPTMWERADEFLQAKREGRVAKDCFVVPEET
ncbi:hypothetical protein MKEN_00401700 [Mycena kentingensis (nom. inval.)]|nr:hypothetical protein MKEN_00401700 [Mycena kentingensis (nom. inval.)]